MCTIPASGMWSRIKLVRFRPAKATRFLGANQKERSLWERDWSGIYSISFPLATIIEAQWGPVFVNEKAMYRK